MRADHSYQRAGWRVAARPRRQPRRPIVVAAGLLVPAALIAGGGLAFAGNQPAQPNPNCTLVVPPNPLSAQGLATPYRLVATNGKKGACHEANPAQAAFVQGTILNPANGAISVYNPLVIDDKSKPAAAPVVPTLAADDVIAVWFGFNGDTLTLRDNKGSLKAGRCVNGLGKSLFTQFAYCNAPAFFQAANTAIGAGMLKVPPAGTGKDGNPCPTTRDFSVIDQDQSDNVTSSYLVQGNTAAQNTAANRAKLRKAKVQVNGSDNLLLVGFVDKALGCTPFQAPDLADGNRPTTSLALDELQAAADQRGTVALVPPNDPMAQVNGKTSIQKLNLYRAGVDMAPVNNAGRLAQDYCRNMVNIQQRQVQVDRNLDAKITSPDRAAANNLFTFLAQRLNASFTNLNCGNLLHAKNPVKVQLKKNVAVNATFAKAAKAVPAGGVRLKAADAAEEQNNPADPAQVGDGSNGSPHKY